MSYPAQTFVADEQPTTAKWNLLWANDASFNDGTGIGDEAIVARHIPDGELPSEKLSATIASFAYLAGAFTINSGADRKIPLDTESLDTGSNFDVANSRFVAPVTGYYFVSGQIGWENLNDGGAAICKIYIDGSEFMNSIKNSGGASNDPSPNVAGVVSVAAGDFIELYALTSDTESATVGTPIRTFLSVHFIGE